MKRAGLLWALLSLVLSFAWQSAARASDDRPIVAVFPVDGGRAGLSARFLKNLADYLASKLTESGKYTVVPRDQLRQRLSREKKNTHKECFDQTCQIELGKELAAEKTMSTKVMKMGRRCTVTLTLYDLGRATTEAAATKHGKCGENGVIDTVDQALDKLFGSEDSLPPPERDKIDSGTDDKKYKRELSKAWAKLTREVKRGSREQKLEKYQTFLSDFPVNNPHQAKVQKRIDGLEAKIAQAEAAKLKKEEAAAALAAKRARAKELKAAYTAAKKNKGSAQEQLKAWQEFKVTYPDDNPYLKTVNRRIAALNKLLSKEEQAQQKRLARDAAQASAGQRGPHRINLLMLLLDDNPEYSEEWVNSPNKALLYRSLSFRNKGEKEDPKEKNKRHFTMAKVHLDLARGQQYIALKNYGDLSKLYLAPQHYASQSPQAKKLVQKSRTNLAEAVKLLSGINPAQSSLPNADEALIKLAIAQNEQGARSASRNSLAALIRVYPLSKYAPLALLILAQDLLLADKKPDTALQYYAKVLKYKYQKAWPFALYQAAWCSYLSSDKATAISRMQKVVQALELFDQSKMPSQMRAALRQVAEKDLAWMQR